MSKAVPRPRPCASCPYRQDAPSGVWDESEYLKLSGYDGDTSDQSPTTFFCHADDGHLCSGWLGHRNPHDLLGLRLAASLGLVDESAFDYTTDVPLFTTGEEAAAHGLKDLECPGLGALRIIGNIERKREAREHRRQNIAISLGCTSSFHNRMNCDKAFSNDEISEQEICPSCRFKMTTENRA